MDYIRAHVERSPVEGAWRDPGALSVSVGYVTANHSVCAIIAHTQHWCGFPYVTKRGQRYGADPSEPPETTPVLFESCGQSNLGPVDHGR